MLGRTHLTLWLVLLCPAPAARAQVPETPQSSGWATRTNIMALKSGSYDEQEPDFLAACEQAVQYHPGELPEAIVHRGNIYLRQGRHREALAAFTAFLERYPNNQYAAYAREAIQEIQRRGTP